MSDQRAYPVVVATLAARIPADVVVPADALAFYSASITDADALEAGVSVESASVLDDVLSVGDLSMSHVLASKVAGYGPIRIRYFLDVALALAAKVDVLDASRVEASGKGAAKTTSLRGSRGLRGRAIRVLKNLAGRRPEEKERLKKAGKGTEKADERARSLETLGKELLEAISKVPPAVALDAGATQELVDALTTAAGAVLATRGSAQGARGTVASLYDEMNVLDGKLLHELRLLVGAMRDARKEDKTIPTVRSALLKSGGKKKSAKKDTTAPVTEGQGAPAEPTVPNG